MEAILEKLGIADYEFLTGIIPSRFNFINPKKLKEALERLKSNPTKENKCELMQTLEKEIRFLGSADIAYLIRYLFSKEPGVPFREIVNDVAKSLKISITKLGTDEELLKDIVEKYTTGRFQQLDREHQQQLLRESGVSKEHAEDFVKQHTKNISIPLMIKLLGIKSVQKIVTDIVIATISNYIGKNAATKLITEVMKKFPVWAEWVGPAMWAITIGWLVFDIQGPAKRKTTPIILYLGLCVIREENL